FLPFNRGHEGGAGNPDVPDEFRVAYLYKDLPEGAAVFGREKWLSVIGRFLHLEKDDGKEALIFPRFQQLLNKNKDLQTLALRQWISSHSTLIVQLTMPDRPSEATIKARESDLGESILLEQLSVSAKGEISAFHRRSGMRF